MRDLDPAGGCASPSSRARNGDRPAEVLHDRVRMAEEVQLRIWSSLIERLAERSGGRGGIVIETRRDRGREWMIAPRSPRCAADR